MSLILGLAVGLAYGLSLFGGAFLALPALVVGAGFTVKGSVPVTLISLALCAAVAAGDGVRARQCEAPLALAAMLGAVPASILLVLALQWLPTAWFCVLFVLAALFAAVKLLQRQTGHGGVLPAALLQAPRRALRFDGVDHAYPLRTRLAMVIGGASTALWLALGAAPGAGFVWQPSRPLAAQPFAQAATALFVVAVAALAGALTAYTVAPSVNGYVTGLYVLGAVAGMGFARRVSPRLGRRRSARVIAACMMLASLSLVVCVLWRGAGSA